MSSATVAHAVTSGTFSLDGQTFDVDNNVWVIGDDTECVVIDAPHSVEEILGVVAGRRVKAIICTHAHDDHVRVAPDLRVATGAPIMLHPDDKPVWELTHPDELWDLDLSDGLAITVGGTTLEGAAHAWACARRRLLVRRGVGVCLHRRHVVQWRPRGHGAEFQ